MKEHRWSGWPGAFCLDCGAPDPTEMALADGALYFDGPDMDHLEIKWEEGMEEKYKPTECPGPP